MKTSTQPTDIDLRAVRPRTGEKILKILRTSPEAATWSNAKFAQELGVVRHTVMGGLKYLELMGLITRSYHRQTPTDPAGRVLKVT